MNLIFTLVLVDSVTALTAWWLSSYDSQLTGDNAQADYMRRFIRCAITLVLMTLGVSACIDGGKFGGFVFLALVVPMALIWVGCASELLARGFHGLVDSSGGSDFDPNKLTNDLDRLAALFEQGRNEEAIELSKRLITDGEASSLAMETMLFRLYDRVFSEERLMVYPALAEAHNLVEHGRVAEAEARLNLLLKQEPDNMAAAVMLLRLNCREERYPDKPLGLLADLESRARLAPFFGSYLRQRVREWLNARSGQENSAEGIESLLVQPNHRAPKTPPGT